jgi:DNA repair exonuclease SbcCD ATPase subunit
MSALSFKINAETDKLKSFISMLEQLRRVLADIPDSTKDFDVINRKIGEMEARVEQSMRKIAQMERQAMDAAAKTAASVTIGNTGGDSTAGAQAAKAETAAYHELIEELKTVNASKKENVILISQYEAQIKRLKSEIDSLNKAESQGMKLTQNQKSSRLEATLSIEEYKQAISRARKELVNQIKFEQVARGSIDEMSQALSRMRTVYRSLNESERTSGWGQNLLKNIESLDTKVKELDATMGVHTRNVGNYASGFNMLGFQIQQVARELPALAYGPQIFFSAISNNLPMLADEIARAKKSVDELKKAGQTFTPVWKQIASSIFSWQTLLVAGVTVLTLYGKEITNWVASLFKGKTAIDAAAAALEQFNSAMAQGSVSAQSELTKLNLLYNAATDLSKPYEERAEAVKKLQDIYPAYFGNMAAEQIMVGNAVGAYENLRDAIIEVAQAKAAQELITEEKKSIARIEQTGDAYTNYSRALKEYRKEYEKAINIYADMGQGGPNAIWGAKGFAESRTGLSKFREEFISALKKMGEEGDDIWKQINEGYEGDVDAFIAAINAGIEKLAPAAEKLYTVKTPAELNAEAKKARDEAKSAAEKAASDQERNLKALNQKLQKLRDDALQAEVDSMKDGTAKKLAQIDLDYQKRARAIQEAEKKLFELQKKEIDAQYKNDTSSERFLAGQQMVAQYKGNVEHLARPLVAAAELVKKGWEDAGEGIATVFSSQFGILDAKGKVTEILVTPILPNGDILSPQELEDYIYTQLEGAQDILAADTKGLVIATNVAADGSAGEKYHELQEVYYADNIKAAEGVRIYTEALREANEEQRNKERGTALLVGQIGHAELSAQFDEEIKSWDGYLQKYGTFREKLQAIKDLYDRRIEEAGTVGERKSLEAERDAAIAEIEVQAGEWIRQLTDKTKDKLAELKTELETSLQSLESEYNALDSSDTEQAQKLRAEINKTKAQINAVNKAASNTQTSPKENAIKKWQRLEKTLGDIADGFKDIGDAVGGTTGEIISAAGEIAATATSMISSIVTLTESSASAITTTSTTAANAIKAVERASVILAIIQAVLSVATKIASLFNNDEEKQAEIDRLQGRIEQLQWELDNANAIRLQRNSFDAVKNVKDAYNNAAKSIMSAYKDVGNFVEKFFIRRSKEAEIEKKAIQSIADAYSNLKYTDSNLLGKNKFGDTRERLNNLAEQQLLLQKQINAENDKKKTDKSKIREWERQIQELGAEAAEVINEVVETIIGGTAEEIAKELGDAFIDAFMEGENAAEAWGEKVDEIVADIMRQMIISKFLEERIGEVFNRYKSKWFKDGVFIGIDNVIDSMSGFADDLNKVGDEFQAIWDSLPAETKELLGNAGAARQEATERGFKAMSQDTGDELNGRFTDIQGKVTDIRGYVMMQTQSIIGLLNSIGNIETAIYTSVQVDNELLRYAVMTYMEIVEINGNTAVMKAALTEIREDIAAIKRNTSEL